MTDHSPPPGTTRLRGFSMSLPMSLLRARESVMQHFRLMLRSFAITEQQWRILRALSSKKTVEISELVAMTFLLGPSISRILKELESRKLVARRTTNQDLRRGIISITDAGLQLIDKVGAHSEAIYSQIAQRYGARKLATLQAMLKDLEVAMSMETTGKTTRHARAAVRRFGDSAPAMPASMTRAKRRTRPNSRL